MRDNAFTFRVSFSVTAHLGANRVGNGGEPVALENAPPNPVKGRFEDSMTQ
jgi:hypothetical protein